jgi:hypothetical protein
MKLQKSQKEIKQLTNTFLSKLVNGEIPVGISTTKMKKIMKVEAYRISSMCKILRLSEHMHADNRNFTIINENPLTDEDYLAAVEKRTKEKLEKGLVHNPKPKELLAEPINLDEHFMPQKNQPLRMRITEFEGTIDDILKVIAAQKGV